MSGSHSSNSSSSYTVNTPTNPEWVDQGVQSFSQLLSGLASQNPQNFVAGPTGLTSQQFDTAAGLGAQGSNWLNQAASLAGGSGQAYGYNPAMVQAAQISPASHATAASALGGIASYLNPYTSDVFKTTLQQADQANRMALNDVGNSAILAGQYGGSRQGVAQALTNSQFQQNMNNLAASLNQQGFNTAAQLSNQDADRTQQAALFNAGADNSQSLAQAQMQQQANLADQGANNQAWQYNAGANDQAAARQLQAAQLFNSMGQYGLGYLGNSAATQQALAQAQAAAPLSVPQGLAGSYSQLPLSLFHGGTTSNNSTGEQNSFSANLSDVGKALTFMMSDPRLKRDMVQIGRDLQGRNIYAFSYKTDPPAMPPRIGYRADEIARSDPDAVAVSPEGYLGVNYDLINAKNQGLT